MHSARTVACQQGLEAMRSSEFAKAAELFERAASEGEGPAAFHYLGVARLKQGELHAAVAAYRKALDGSPESWHAQYALAMAYLKLGDVKNHIANLKTALELAPERHAVHTNLIFAMDLDPGATEAEQQAERRRWYERYGRAEPAPRADFPNSRDPERRLRIGYVSADFNLHAAAIAFGPVLRRHDASRFEIFCYYNERIDDLFTGILRRAASAWREIADTSDDEVARRIRDDRIDILVDLSGHTGGHRLGVFARKPAPVQITAWGAVNGTGNPMIDYVFSDAVSVPAEWRGLFAEEVVELPCCLCYEAPADGPEVAPLPSARGEPFTFGCMNRTEKVSDEAIALWSRILRAMPRSRLLLKSRTLGIADVAREMQRRFAEKGIGADRLLLLGMAENTFEHLKTFERVDVALDPLPQSGMITSAESLWMGAPIVTLLGRTTPGRICAAILTAAGLPDFIARSEDEYVEIALDLAADPIYLGGLRRSMREQLVRTPVFNGAAYTRYVEDAYRAVWKRWCEAPGR